jgi:hypothetical protein
MLRKLFIAAVLAALTGSALAQSSKTSEFTLTPYLWNAGFEGTIGASDGGGRVDADFSGLLDAMEVSGIMLYADWRRDRWTVFGEWTHVKVTSSVPSPFGALYAGLDSEIKGNIVQGAVGYRVLGDRTSGVDVFGGLRYYNLEARLDLLPRLLAARSVSGSETWTDAIVGARWRGRLSGNWVAALYGDVGAGGSDSTWQAVANIGYEFQWGSILGGWRHLVADYEKDGLKIDAALSGPFLGASFRF